MVYEKKCAECGQILDFGGEDPGSLPEGAIEFNDNIYCKNCVQKFVEFGTGNITERIEMLETTLEEVADELGIEKGWDQNI